MKELTLRDLETGEVIKRKGGVAFEMLQLPAVEKDALGNLVELDRPRFSLVGKEPKGWKSQISEDAKSKGR